MKAGGTELADMPAAWGGAISCSDVAHCCEDGTHAGLSYVAAGGDHPAVGREGRNLEASTRLLAGGRVGDRNVCAPILNSKPDTPSPEAIPGTLAVIKHTQRNRSYL